MDNYTKMPEGIMEFDKFNNNKLIKKQKNWKKIAIVLSIIVIILVIYSFYIGIEKLKVTYEEKGKLIGAEQTIMSLIQIIQQNGYVSLNYGDQIMYLVEYVPPTK